MEQIHAEVVRMICRLGNSLNHQTIPLKVSEISSESHLQDQLKLDSYSLMELAIAINEKWGIDLGRASAKGRFFHTVGDVVRCIEDDQNKIL